MHPSHTASHVLQARNLSLTRHGRVLLAGADITIPIPPSQTNKARGIIGLVGANGSGKTTLISVLAGLTQADRGEVLLAGKPPTPRQISVMLQKPVIMRRSVAANFAYVLVAMGVPRQQQPEATQAMLAKLKLTHLAQQTAHTLSAGEAQRMALGRCLLGNPLVLLCDEATSNCDPASMHLIEEIVRAEAQQGLAVVWVSHNLAQIRRLADTVLFMERGRLSPPQATDAFFTNPTSDAARNFIAQERI